MVVPKKVISCRSPDNAYINCTENDPCPVEFLKETPSGYEVLFFVKTEDLFQEPVRSKELLNFKVTGKGLRKRISYEDASRLPLSRAIKMTCEGETYFMVLVHDNDIDM